MDDITQSNFAVYEVSDFHVYDCPTCELRIVASPEEAEKHMRFPLGRGIVFPRGFVFQGPTRISTGIHVVRGMTQARPWSPGNIAAGRNPHDVIYDLETYLAEEDCRKEQQYCERIGRTFDVGYYNPGRLFAYDHVDSREIKEELQQERCRLLSAEELVRFKTVRVRKDELFDGTTSPFNDEL